MNYGAPREQDNPFGGSNNYQNQRPQNQNRNNDYTRMDEDPFANSKGPIEVSEDDLPF